MNLGVWVRSGAIVVIWIPAILSAPRSQASKVQYGIRDSDKRVLYVRLFQNSGVYAGYLPKLARLTSRCSSFLEYRRIFLAHRYSACHILAPAQEGDAQAFFTNGDDVVMQRRWAIEQGMPQGASLESILLSQIEAHRTEVFYNLDPVRYGNEFVRRLPGCVKHTLAWRAAPSGGRTFSAYGRVLCNFPGMLRDYELSGCKVAYFTPAHDPVMDQYAANTDRPVDVLFVGGYSRHHRKRAEILEAVAHCHPEVRVVFHLERSRLTKLADSPLGILPPLAAHRRPAGIRSVSAEAVFGLDLYTALSRAKIVLNGSIDMAGDERGNMRCWEAMGCGALMLSDRGTYPRGMMPGRDFATYADAAEAVHAVRDILRDFRSWQSMAENGHASVSMSYSKEAQWNAFGRIVADM